ncbi:hypothetical protein F4803DRAFT_109993 [Xylaria telfairii]|nr:hypothetical protein F4803DRAFT_109993 [Xylaria telfairii]
MGRPCGSAAAPVPAFLALWFALVFCSAFQTSVLAWASEPAGTETCCSCCCCTHHHLLGAIDDVVVGRRGISRRQEGEITRRGHSAK